MKKILSLILCMTMIFSLFSCSFINKHTNNDKNENENNTVISGENDIILLIDASYSMKNTQQKIENFIDGVIRENTNNNIGIVTFGYNQVYAAELSSKVNDIYSKYALSQTPDTSATNIADAITYAASLFTNPQKAKIVLMSDGIETDGNALEAVKDAAAKGIIIDTVALSNTEQVNDAQIIDMKRPKTKIKFAEEFTVELTIQSSFAGDATLSVYNDGNLTEIMDVKLVNGKRTIKVPLTFDKPNLDNLHKLSFELKSSKDSLNLNNTFHSYILVESFNKILILESIDGESDAIQRVLNPAEASDSFDITVYNIAETEKILQLTNDILLYDQVILCNVSYGQMPTGFDKVLFDYVTEFGGGLFTVCGTDETGEANAFTKEDLRPSQYLKKLLPVDVYNFTPPVAVMILIDKSGSMYSEDFYPSFEESKLYYALQGARKCLDLLSDRDYIGVYELDDYGEENLELTPATHQTKILNAIENIGKDGGGTIFSTALAAAGRALMAQTNVEKKHIIVITDGEPDAANVELTKEVMLENAAKGITTSIVGIQCTASAQALMKDLLVEYAGVEEKNFHNVAKGESVHNAVRDDMGAPEITDVNWEDFQIQISLSSDITNGIEQEDMPYLGGFYGMKAKDADGDNNDLTKDLRVLLKSTYTPIYTQWTYGKGKVGTFGCDLNGTWSEDFINSPVGKTIIQNIVSELMPYENIRKSTVDADFEGDNYKTKLNVYTTLEADEYILVTVNSPDSPQQIFIAGIDENYSKFYFDITTPGVHEILVRKMNAVGIVVSEKRLYKSIGYSKEYDMFYDHETAITLLENIAKTGKGHLITDPKDVFNFVPGTTITEDKENEENKYNYNVAILDTRMVSFDNRYTLEVDVVCYGRNERVTVYARVEGNQTTDDPDLDERDGVSDGLCDVEFVVDTSVNLRDGEITTVTIPGFTKSDFATEKDYNEAYKTECPELYNTVDYKTVTSYVEVSDERAEDDRFTLTAIEKVPLKILYSSNNPNNYFSTAFLIIREKLKYRFDIDFEEFILVPEMKDQEIPTEGYDIYIYERYMPETLPEDGVTIISDPLYDINGAGFKIGSEKYLKELTYFTPGEYHPITENITPESICVTKFTDILNPEGKYIPILYCGSEPILYATDKNEMEIEGEANVVLMPFSLNYSNLPIIVDFPLMMYNIMEYYFGNDENYIPSERDPVNIPKDDDVEYDKEHQTRPPVDTEITNPTPSGGSKYEEAHQVIDGQTYYKDALNGNTEYGESYYDILREYLEKNGDLLTEEERYIIESYLNIL